MHLLKSRRHDAAEVTVGQRRLFFELVNVLFECAAFRGVAGLIDVASGKAPEHLLSTLYGR